MYMKKKREKKHASQLESTQIKSVTLKVTMSTVFTPQ